MAVPTVLVFGVLAVLSYRKHKRQIQGPDEYQPPAGVMTIWNVSDSTASTVSWCFKSSHQLRVEKQPNSVNMFNRLYSPLQGPYMSHGTLLHLPYSPRVAKKCHFYTSFSSWHHPSGTFVWARPFGPWRPWRGILRTHVSTYVCFEMRCIWYRDSGRSLCSQWCLWFEERCR